MVGKDSVSFLKSRVVRRLYNARRFERYTGKGQEWGYSVENSVGEQAGGSPIFEVPIPHQLWLIITSFLHASTVLKPGTRS